MRTDSFGILGCHECFLDPLAVLKPASQNRSDIFIAYDFYCLCYILPRSGYLYPSLCRTDFSFILPYVGKQVRY